MKIEAIKARMTEKGIKSMNELERRADLGLNTVYRWPEKSPSVDKVFRVAKVLGCTVDDLIRDDPTEAPGGEDEPEAQYFRSVAN